MPLARVRFGTAVNEDEIDIDSGFLLLPPALSVATSAPATTGTDPIPSVEVSGSGPTLVLTPSPGESSDLPSSSISASQKSVEINFSADRNQLFSAWNAIANLADLAGKVTVTVRADSAEGFDKNKLQNGVLEPLRESDLIK